MVRSLHTLFAALVFVAGGWYAIEGENYHPERTKFMDSYPPQSPTKFLFRGNMPIVNGSFAYTQILATMKEIIQQHPGFVMPINFDLIVVSYLNEFESHDLEIERRFFKDNSSVGEFHNIVVIGCEVAPPNKALKCERVKELLDIYEKDIAFDNVPKLMTTLRGLLTEHARPALIYTHCEAGTDRTGEVSGAYYLKFLNMSFSEALNIDNSIQNRPMYNTSRNALQWYCLYLQCYEGFTMLNCTVPTGH